VTHWQTPTHEPENGSFILTPGVDTNDGVQLIKRGPVKSSEGCGGGFHECIESPLHLQSDLCASCHDVYHYDTHFPLEMTYLEWKHGPYAQKGIMCQDCHMVDTDTLNMKQKFDMAVAKLKAAADLELSPVYRNGTLAEVKVRVRNIRAGHNLPTSLTNVRQMWLEVMARDAGGTVVLTSGGLDKEGALVPETRNFNSDGMGEDFHFALDPWVVTAFSRHDTIPPRGYKDATFGVAPSKKPGAVTVEARLRYRQADKKVARKLLSEVPKDIDLEKIYGMKEVPTLPVVDMVVKKATFTSRQ
jgi:hypothetical protein